MWALLAVMHVANNVLSSDVQSGSQQQLMSQSFTWRSQLHVVADVWCELVRRRMAHMYRTNFMAANEDQVLIKDNLGKCAKVLVTQRVND